MGRFDNYFGAKEKVQGVIQDVKASKEIKQGIAELEALPEFEGSIIYKMELEAMSNYLNSLLLVVNDSRLDDASVIEEIREVMGKVQPAAQPEAQEEAGSQPGEGEQPSEINEQPENSEQQAIAKLNAIVYDSCERALAALSTASE